MQTLEDFLKRRLNFGVGQRPFRRAEHQAVRHALFPGGNLRAAVNVEQLDAFQIPAAGGPDGFFDFRDRQVIVASSPTGSALMSSMHIVG